MRAFNLYNGVYWSGVAKLWRKAVSRQGDASLWIMSAGYGLISSDAVLAPYSATLSRNDDDSVIVQANPQGIHEWWSAIASWKGPEPGQPRTLTALAKAHPDTLWLIVGGSNYVKAISGDLDTVQATDGSAGRFLIISPGLAGEKVSTAVRTSLVQADSRWEGRLGRGKVAIGIRIATYLFDLAEGNPNKIFSARTAIETDGASLKPVTMPARVPQSDAQVRTHLRKEIKTNPSISFSSALREFRDSGHACEYKRFRALYQDVKGAHGATA